MYTVLSLLLFLFKLATNKFKEMKNSPKKVSVEQLHVEDIVSYCLYIHELLGGKMY